MTAPRDEVRALFHAAVERPPSEREILLRAASAEVREEVQSLLAAHDDSGAFLDRAAWEVLSESLGGLVSTTVGPYRVLQRIGHGGMGTVYLAVREAGEFAQRVAIKVVRGGDALVARFRQERQILAALEHPNIARLLDGGTAASGDPYLVMEYVEGTPIDRYCEQLRIPDILRLFLQLCDAVQYAHRNLVIHRDLKPANVLVTAGGAPKLLDFGIARLVSTTDEASTRVMTPDYASPEQLLGRAVTTASDVYALGVLLYELLAKRRPFAVESRDPQAEAPPPSILSGDRALRGDLDSIVLTALEVDPSRRYGSVDKLADDIRRHLDRLPVLARRNGIAVRTVKFVRRNTAVVTASLLIVAAIAAGFAATLHQKRIAERRFAEVRSLAQAVVFELHDAIEPLPGSTRARELLVRRALVYLDTLAREAAGNRSLQIELARAYIKVGDVQGAPYRANLGDTAGAIASYRKALDIARQVAHDAPGDGAATALLADAHDHLGFVQQRASRWREAITSHERARELREALPPSPRRDLALAKTWTAIGDCRYIGGAAVPPSMSRGTPEQAYTAALATLSHIPLTGQLQRDALVELGRAHQRLGGFYSGPRRRDLPLAIRHHDAALRALAARTALDPRDAVARRNYADQFVMKATAQNAMHDGAGALQSAERGLAILQRLAETDPANVEAQHDVAFALTERASALAILGRVQEAARGYEDAIAIHRRLLAADPTNREDRRDLEKVEGLLARLRKNGVSFSSNRLHS